MCELLAMCSLQPAQLTFSLETLASHGSPAGRTRDGWGAAFYQGNDVALFREPAAAGDSALVRFLETQGPQTTLAISHIRRATRGAVTLANTQPFQRRWAGRAHVFAHNGDLPGLEQGAPLTSTHCRPVGTTDSEHAFCLLLERIGTLWQSPDRVPPLNRRLEVIVQFAAELRERGPANFLYADGESLFVHGDRRIQADGTIAPPGLFMLSRRCSHAGETVSGHGMQVGAGFQEVTLVASVPLTAEDWRPLARGEVLAITSGKVVAAGNA